MILKRGELDYTQSEIKNHNSSVFRLETPEEQSESQPQSLSLLNSKNVKDGKLQRISQKIFFFIFAMRNKEYPNIEIKKERIFILFYLHATIKKISFDLTCITRNKATQI